jgi:hypothetical protein
MWDLHGCFSVDSTGMQSGPTLKSGPLQTVNSVQAKKKNIFRAVTRSAILLGFAEI